MPRLNKEEVFRMRLVVNGDQNQKELFEVEKRIRSLKEENKSYQKQKAKLRSQNKQDSKEYKNLTAAIRSNNKEVNEAKVRMRALQKEIGLSGLTMAQLQRRARELRTVLRNMIPGSPERKKMEAELRAINSRMKQLRLTTSATQSSISRLGNAFNRYAALGGSVIATVTGVVFSLQRMIDFNGKLSDAQANVRRTTGLTADEVDELTKSFGALKTRAARTELLKFAEEAGRLGFNTVDSVKEFAEVANKMSIALTGDLDFTQIREVGKMVNVFRLGEKTGRSFGESMESLGSAINEVSESGANNADFLVDFLKRLAGVGPQANISATQVLGYAAAFDELGQRAETSSTAMNRVIVDIFQKPETYARIAQIPLKEFTNLLDHDANEAFLKFLEGLNGTDEGFKVMAKRLEKIQVGGARGVQSLAALAANTDLVRKRQATAAEALDENISLTREYNVLNNNLAANLQKVGRQLRGLFLAGPLNSGLNSLVRGFGKMIGAIKDTNQAFDDETKSTFENAKAAQKAASESANLLSEYERLTKDGIEPSAEAKDRLDTITLQLRDRLGENVVTLNEETGEFILNTEAVKKNIAAKRLQADQEASTLASRLIGANQEIENLKKQEKVAKRELDLRRKFFSETNNESADNPTFDPYGGVMKYRETLPGFKEMREATVKYSGVIEDLNEQERRRVDLLAKLKGLNFTEEDINKLFLNSGSDSGPKEGDRQMINDVLMVFRNGKWVPVVPEISTDDEKPNSSRVKSLRSEERELTRIIEENEKKRAALVQDTFLKELAQEDIRYKQRIQQLSAFITDEAELQEIKNQAEQAKRDGHPEQYDYYIHLLELRKKRNKEINESIETAVETHEMNVASILQKAESDQMKQAQTAFEQQQQQRTTTFNNQLAQITSLMQAREKLESLGYAKEAQRINSVEEAKQIIREDFRQKELRKQAEFLEKLIQQFSDIMKGGQFMGFDLEILTPEQEQAIEQQIDKLKAKLAELNVELAKARGEDPAGSTFTDSLGSNDFRDPLGMTPDDWNLMFDNIENGTNLIGVMAQSVGMLTDIWGQYNEFRNAAENKQMEQFRRDTEEQKTRQQNLLDQGLISQRQYDSAVQSLEEKQKKREAELEYKQAKRQKETDLAKAVSNGALAVTNALATVHPFPAALVAAALAASMSALQVATISKSPLPARGFEEGLYPVERSQDGKLFNARYKGYSRSGLVDEPSLFLAGEEGSRRPEMIINGSDYANFAPDFKASLSRELARVRGYEDGFDARPSNTSDFDNNNPQNELLFTAMVEALNRNSEIMEKIEKDGIYAKLVRSMRNARDLKTDIDNYIQTRNRARV